MIRMKWSIACFAASLLILQGCVESSDSQRSSDDDLTTATEADKSSVLRVGEAVFSIPSPVQTALLIERSGADYDASLPNATANAGNYISATDKSLAMGVYGANLAYYAIFDQNQEALSCMTVLEQLANELDLAGAIDRGLIRRFSENLGNQDSLLVLSSHFFRHSDGYLKENERDLTAALIIAGGWVEGMFMALNSTNGKGEIRQRIAEQKHALNGIVSILERHGSDDIASLITSLKDLQALFDGVKTTYEYKRPDVDAAGKITHLKSETSYSITDELFAQIIEELESIRNSIVS